ncbi:HEAT repeat domain-containing protein [Daejeonella sp.]|uniref:HEAT repeat domain-containing protein n=1 Tax=Daejeonella sp. TaxID=2805397 RepID=UPI0030C2AFC3
MMLTALSSVEFCTVISSDYPDIVRLAAFIAFVASILTIVVVFVIFYNRVAKLKARKIADEADNIILEELGEHIFNYDSVDDIPEHELKATVRTLNSLKNQSSALRNSVVRLLVYFQKNLTGAVSRIVSSAYSRLRLREFALRKLRSSYWFYKTQGLAEVQAMKDDHSLPEVYKLLKDSNQDVRVAAYTVLLRLKAKDCFDFMVKEPDELSDWHQIVLHDAMVKTEGLEIPDFKIYFSSENTSIIFLSIKLIVDYKQFNAIPKLLSFLDHDDERVRNHLIMALGQLQAENGEDRLIERYAAESIKNKAAILIALGRISSGLAVKFITEKFLEAEHFLVLKCAAAAIFSHPEPLREKILKDLPDLNNEQKAILRHVAEPSNNYGIL